MSLDIVDSLRSDPNVTIVPQTGEQFECALQHYRQRLDKGYSLTDCASMLIMKDEKMNAVLTYDHHFQQEGFSALLRND
jgi:predicted nucleic acid-binding protein